MKDKKEKTTQKHISFSVSAGAYPYLMGVACYLGMISHYHLSSLIYHLLSLLSYIITIINIITIITIITIIIYHHYYHLSSLLSSSSSSSAENYNLENIHFSGASGGTFPAVLLAAGKQISYNYTKKTLLLS